VPTQRNLADALNWICGPLELPRSPQAPPSPELPATYRKLLEHIGPGEGFIGHEYLRLFAIDQLPWVNDAYAIGTYLPGYYLFGSNGCGEAYLFGPSTPHERPVIRIAFVPLDMEYASKSWPSFGHFLFALVNAPPEFEDSAFPDTPNPDAVGMEVHEVHPIGLGGDPTDQKNKVLVPVQKHVELVSFWNKTFHAIRQRTRA
jgi:hypothetical protein